VQFLCVDIEVDRKKWTGRLERLSATGSCRRSPVVRGRQRYDHSPEADSHRRQPAAYKYGNEGIVLRGLLQPLGMGRFEDVITREDAEAIHGCPI
jgi:hypothetical protein